MSKQDIRWQQRYSQFRKAYGQVDSAMQLMIDNENLIDHIKRVGKVFYEKAN